MSQANRIVVLLPDGRALALAPEAYQAALAEGLTLSGPPRTTDRTSDESLLDAEQLAAVLSVPASWIEQKAREGVIPSLEFGRWRRFRRSEVEASVRRLSGARAA
jgi:excisionase family DNA binding protein